MSHQQAQRFPERMTSGEVAVEDAVGLADRSQEVLRHEVATDGAAVEGAAASTSQSLMHLLYAVRSFERVAEHAREWGSR